MVARILESSACIVRDEIERWFCFVWFRLKMRVGRC